MAQASVERAATLLVDRKRSALDGTLFRVAQLLALREQIAPFETDFAITHKALDFTQTREAVRPRRLHSARPLHSVFALVSP